MRRNLQQITDECVEAILSGRATVEECLARYVDLRAELEPMLIAAGRLLSDADVSASSARKQASKDRLLSAVERKRWESGIERAVLLDKPRVKAPRRLWSRLVAVGAIFVLLSGATTAMANQSLPGSPLYPIKRAVENAKISLTFDEGQKRLLYMQAAEHRMDELEKLDSSDENYSQLISEMTDSIEQAVEPTGEAVAATGDDRIARRLHVIEKRKAKIMEQKLKAAPAKLRASIEKKLKRLELLTAASADKIKSGISDNGQGNEDSDKSSAGRNNLKQEDKEKRLKGTIGSGSADESETADGKDGKGSSSTTANENDKKAGNKDSGDNSTGAKSGDNSSDSESKKTDGTLLKTKRDNTLKNSDSRLTPEQIKKALRLKILKDKLQEQKATEAESESENKKQGESTLQTLKKIRNRATTTTTTPISPKED